MINNLSKRLIHTVKNYYNGEWSISNNLIPLNNNLLVSNGINNQILFKNICHSPFYNTHMYREYGNICYRLSNKLLETKNYNNLLERIKTVYAKSDNQIRGELDLTIRYIQNLAGDNCQYICRGISTVGDNTGEYSIDWPMPYGRVAIIAPFNFPIEIPALQLLGALITGNRPLLHVDYKVSYAMEYFIELMLDSGVPKDNFSFVNGYGSVFEPILLDYKPKQTLFTGSSKIANHLIHKLSGRIKIEDSGFNWKYLGNDVFNLDAEKLNKILTTCYLDAYENSGQKCSSTRLLFVPNNHLDFVINNLNDRLNNPNIIDKHSAPLMSITNNDIINYLSNVKKYIPNYKLIGSLNETPLAIVCRYDEFEKHINKLANEIFGPVQFICGYNDCHDIVSIISNIPHQLTAAIVTENKKDIEILLSNSQNGTTYVGLNARTTGTLENRWFGPGGDPLAGAIGTPEAIRSMWTYNRCINYT